jgi:hypothetical protein
MKALIFGILILVIVLSTATVGAQTSAERTVGVLINNRAFEGYNLYTPLLSTTTYLFDNRGKVVHTWESDYLPPSATYLLENGHLLTGGGIASDYYLAGGRGGWIEEMDWDGNTVWVFEHYDNVHNQYWLHHDFEKLPNGNVLMLAWEMKTYDEAIAAGRNPDLEECPLPDTGLWPEKIIEVKPDYASGYGGDIVWEWHVWDHIIQDYDSTKANYGDVGAHPELVDLNYCSYVAANDADWQHANSIDYHPALDQIVISARTFDEIWIIDHSTTTAQAAGHTGGRSGKGGDLLYRWGNPQTYRAGGPGDKQLFNQHDATWIEPGYPGAGNILIFNNGRFGPEYSSVVEITPPMDRRGNYFRWEDAFGPTVPRWEYKDPANFYSTIISGAQRLPNGNTLVCDGTSGHIFEVAAGGQRRQPYSPIVWKFISPFTDTGALTQGEPVPAGLRPDFEAYMNLVFRLYRYPPNYPGFAGKDLTPGDPLENYSLSVNLDIAPGSCPNPLNTWAPLKVAIVGTEDFDVSLVEARSIWLDGVRPLRWAYRDVSTPSNDGCNADGPDGITDLVLDFDGRTILTKFAGISNGDQIQLHLSGNNISGQFFLGKDTVVVNSTR